MSRKKAVIKVTIGLRLDPEFLMKLRKEAERQSGELGFNVTITDVITQACKKLLGLI